MQCDATNLELSFFHKSTHYEGIECTFEQFKSTFQEQTVHKMCDPFILLNIFLGKNLFTSTLHDIKGLYAMNQSLYSKYLLNIYLKMKRKLVRHNCDTNKLRRENRR